MKIQRNIIEKATELAKASNVDQGKIGAVLFTNNGHILTFASNTAFFTGNKFTIHAEEFVIAKAVKMKIQERYKDDKLYLLVVRYKKSIDGLGIAKPCNKCQKLLNETDFTVYYSDREGKIKKL